MDFSDKEKRHQGMLLNFILCYGGKHLTPSSIPWMNPVEAQKVINMHNKNRETRHDVG